LHLSSHDADYVNKVNEAELLADSIVTKAVAQAVRLIRPRAMKLRKRLVGLVANNSENFSNQAISVATKQLLAIWADDADKIGRIATINQLEARKRELWERIEDAIAESCAEYLNQLVEADIKISALHKRGELVALTEQIVLEHIESVTNKSKEKHVSTPAC
jgi:hypothetical protein